MTTNMFKEDWWPMTPRISDLQVEWCQNRSVNNVRYRKNGDSRWRRLNDGTGVTSGSAEFAAKDMLRGNRQSIFDLSST